MTETTTPYRDEELGAALRELEVPEHGPEFFADLERRLAPQRPSRRSRPRRRLAVPAVAAAAAAAAAAVLAVGLPGTGRTPSVAGPEAADAAVVRAHVRAAIADLRNLSGVIVANGPAQDDTRRWRFTLDARGDFRLAGPGAGEEITYDAAAGVARSAQRSASMGGDAIFYAERRGVAPGPPDPGPPTWILPDELGAYVRALLAAHDPAVREVVYEGRPAWHVDIATVPNAIVPDLSGDRLEVTVDRRTGIPVRVVESKKGAVLRELRIERLAVDRDLSRDAFRLAFPPGAEVMRSDEGFRRVSVDQVAGIVGYAPLVPARVPAGYDLAEVAVATEAGPTGTDGGNPPSRMVVSLSYRRGLDQLLVTTRLAGAGTWSDPLASGEGLVDRPERIRLDTGALAGVDAELVLSPRGIPHVWAVTDRLVVTVSGDLSRTELLAVAGSLRAHG